MVVANSFSSDADPNDDLAHASMYILVESAQYAWNPWGFKLEDSLDYYGVVCFYQCHILLIYTNKQSDHIEYYNYRNKE